jgi:hydroxymethylglutaryl-CoA synthase
MKMIEEAIGISDIGLYVPTPRMDLRTLTDERVATVPQLRRHFDRAIRVTGQRAIRFPRPWEDTATMAAEATAGLLDRLPAERIRRLRSLAVGTESAVDHSKPVSAYVQGMLTKGGYPIPETLASYQVQHACAAGTMSLLNVAGNLALTGLSEEFGIAVCSDVARYEGKSTAEVTQGAGSVAMLVERNPKLVALDLEHVGYCSRDVDDFFRPLGSVTAKVKGQYSMQCYRQNLDGALADYAGRAGTTVKDLLASTDYFVLHAPFRNMPAMALERLIQSELGLDETGTQEFLAQRGFYDAYEVVADVGNIYTGSMYLSLASLLSRRYQAEGNGIVGKRILFASYGSGNTMIVYSGTVAAQAPTVIPQWGQSVVDEGLASSMEGYEIWMHQEHIRDHAQEMPLRLEVPAGRYYLASRRDDGYREYAFAQAATSWPTTAAAPQTVEAQRR